MKDFTIIYMNPSKKGSNQYQSRYKRYFGLKSTTWITILVILGLVLLAALFLLPMEYYSRHLSMMANSMKVYAQVPEHEYVVPPLADKPERERNIELIRRYFGKDAETAIKVFTCESGLRTKAINTHNWDGRPDVGIAQIHIEPSDPFTVKDMEDPYANILEAKHKFDTRGWQPWISSNECHHALD